MLANEKLGGRISRVEPTAYQGVGAVVVQHQKGGETPRLSLVRYSSTADRPERIGILANNALNHGIGRDFRQINAGVEQLSPQLYNDQVDVLFPDVKREGFVAVVTNTSTAHYWAVAKGAGLGMLPTYLWAIGARVEPVDIGLQTQFDIWLTYHASMRKAPRIAATIDWLKSTFDPKTFPWFRDEFIPPEKLEQAARDNADQNLFDGFAGRTSG